LAEIFSQLQQVGLDLTIDILVNGYNRMPQDDRFATYCKRRTPAGSEITLDELKYKTSVDLYNKVRMLADPYPNAFIRTSDGRKLVLKLVEVGD
jgi:methionyl-tRNA formyltransferase